MAALSRVSAEDMTIFTDGVSAKINGIAVMPSITGISISSHDDVEIVFFHSINSIFAVRCRCHYLYTRIFFKKTASEAAHNSRIINHHYFNGSAVIGRPGGCLG